MRDLVITQNVTLDGAVEMLDDWFDPLAEDKELTEEMNRQDEHCDAVLFGRRTFTDMRGFWPQQTADTTGVTEYLNRTRKYVFSSTLVDPEWQHTTILSGDPVAEVRRLKEQPGRTIALTGSITLAYPLIEAGLVDEYRMFTYPVVQGRGRRFYPDGYTVPRLRLLRAASFASGVTYTAYAPVV
ncbi:dihydrofolate reductase [Murinocardiopsis flavida]|uniref:Dihydrofolate reductase n=1 Tax=Murinocardiopsis flavida TaxID=645275 RepID=A0A2P8DST3_9ACTN|nr:dihydrofolate reductase family protein [Murinocardiopsis flavida]PSL00272.1 dihydrofolate reductase [Murinocardiopsis flavida]